MGEKLSCSQTLNCFPILNFVKSSLNIKPCKIKLISSCKDFVNVACDIEWIAMLFAQIGNAGWKTP